MSIRKNNEIIAIKEILGEHFVIPTYQRGYRWTRFQVEDLLNDIKDFEDDETKSDSDYYCLQPLVVKETESGEYRVIDGQQRLTTIWLLLNCLNRPDVFRLEYERLNELALIKEFAFDEEFSAYKLTKQQINSKALKAWNEYVDRQWRRFRESRQGVNVEVFHLFAAWLFIKNWLADHREEQWLQQLDQPTGFIHHVKVIWHVADREIETFQHLNSGKIPLTDAELIKALFLSTYGHQRAENQLRQKLIAEEYDSIERQLRVKDFWYFLNGSGPQPTSCISFLFTLLQEIESGNAYEGQPLHTYFYFRDIINSLGDVNKVWERVTDMFHVLEGWYHMPEIYNLVGFLRAKDRSMRAIYEAYVKCGTIDEFRNHLLYKCLESIGWYDEALAQARATHFETYLTENFRYDTHYDRAWNLLLLVNIATLNLVKVDELNRVRKVSKFSFADFHNCKWQIEHISPRQAKVTEGLEIPGIDEMPPVGTKVAEVEDWVFKEKIDPYVAALDESIMSLPNLTFLSNHINASIGNRSYAEKRDRVLKKQSEGFYLLPSSLMVFTKGYTDEEGHAKEFAEGKTRFWSDIDRAAYLDWIKRILSDPYFDQAKEIDSDREKQCVESCTPVFSYTSSVKEFLDQGHACEEALESFNYLKLIERFDYVIIPKIQRDYAQGRRAEADERAAKVREILIKDLFDAGSEGLDFQIIFGTQEVRREIKGAHVEEKKVFVPIDGQQRLTTLFLLDLYQYKAAECTEEQSAKRTPAFIYETRSSASDFCVDVVNNRWMGFPENSPREAITRATWFQQYWLDDPTVEGMLVMLDAIHAEATRTRRFPAIDRIHFAYFNLGQEHLSETIYLKMNTRGKELTSFENLKAAIEKEFTDLSQEWKRNIDGTWLDAFWNSEQPTELPDMRIMRFLANALFVKLCAYEVLTSGISLEEALKSNEPQKGEDDYEAKKKVFDRLVVTRDLLGVAEKKQPQYISSAPYVQALKCVDPKLEYLSAMLDGVAAAYEVRPSWDSEVSELLDSNYTQRAVLYAFSLFLTSCGRDKEGYTDWMRFVWNIAEHDATDYKAFIRTCRLFDRLAQRGGCRHILKTLQLEEVKSFSGTDQFKEELEKASVSEDAALFELIKKAESHAFFHGTIRFLYGGESTRWDGFLRKVSQLDQLVPVFVDERRTVSLLIPYLPDGVLKELFSKCSLSNDDANLRAVFLSEVARPYLDDFFAGKETKPLTALQKQLVALAPVHPNFFIRNTWGNHRCALTSYKHQSGYYAVNSYSLDDSIYYRVQDLLREEPFVPQIQGVYREAWHNGYLVGLEMDFRYQGLKFRYYNENHCIRLMGSDWAQRLYEDAERTTCCFVGALETRDSLLGKMDAMVEYSKERRVAYLKEIRGYFQSLGLEPSAVGWNSSDAVEEIVDFCPEKVDSYDWVCLEIPLDLFSIAFAIDRHHRMEVGLCKWDKDLHEVDCLKLLKPHSHREYSPQHPWWHYVYACNHFDGMIAREELDALLAQYGDVAVDA